jgi:hypothetical protein
LSYLRAGENHWDQYLRAQIRKAVHRRDDVRPGVEEYLQLRYAGWFMPPLWDAGRLDDGDGTSDADLRDGDARAGSGVGQVRQYRSLQAGAAVPLSGPGPSGQSEPACAVRSCAAM